jgi:hypothetical protein
MRSRFLGLGLAAAVFAGTVACDEDLSSLTGPTPNLTPTFSSIQNEIFNTTDSSGRTACHLPHAAAFQRRTDRTVAYGNLVGVASRQCLRRLASFRRP